jgi:xanthine dehydrogenase accessory factor
MTRASTTAGSAPPSPAAQGTSPPWGSRATHRQRLRRLDGLPGLHRLAAPAGLDLGGASLSDTALSILAEMVAAENGRGGGPLRDGDLSIRAVRV